jgi:serine/threonine protein phosphatase PrpC
MPGCHLGTKALSRKKIVNHDPEETSHFSGLTPRDGGHKPAETSERALQNYWVDNGLWQVHSEKPEGSCEDPFHERDFEAHPGNLDPLRKFGIAAINVKGKKNEHDRSIGQDFFSISQLADGWQLFCVMDGHGIHGDFAALHCARSLPYLMQTRCSELMSQGAIRDAFSMAFQLTHFDLERSAQERGWSIITSGATVACAMYHKERGELYIAHAGDSRVVLFDEGKGVVTQTEDHTCDVATERQRIEKAGGEIKKADDQHHERIFLKGKEWPGLVATRTLGDMRAKNIGVIAMPVVAPMVEVKKLKNPYLLLASDGVWEMFHEPNSVVDNILKGISNGFSYDTVLSNLARESRNLWKEHDDGVFCDDITAILVSLTGDPDPAEDTNPKPYAQPRPFQSFSTIRTDPVCGTRECGTSSCSCM